MNRQQAYQHLSRHATFRTISPGWFPEELLVQFLYNSPAGLTVAEMALLMAGNNFDPVPYVNAVSDVVGELVDKNVLVCGRQAVYELHPLFRDFCNTPHAV